LGYANGCGSFSRRSTTDRGWSNWWVYRKNLCRGSAKAAVSHQAESWICQSERREKIKVKGQKDDVAKMKVLITGVAGFIGSNLVERLLAEKRRLDIQNKKSNIKYTDLDIIGIDNVAFVQKSR